MGHISPAGRCHAGLGHALVINWRDLVKIWHFWSNDEMSPLQEKVYIWPYAPKKMKKIVRKEGLAWTKKVFRSPPLVRESKRRNSNNTYRFCACRRRYGEGRKKYVKSHVKKDVCFGGTSKWKYCTRTYKWWSVCGCVGVLLWVKKMRSDNVALKIPARNDPPPNVPLSVLPQGRSEFRKWAIKCRKCRRNERISFKDTPNRRFFV